MEVRERKEREVARYKDYIESLNKQPLEYKKKRYVELIKKGYIHGISHPTEGVYTYSFSSLNEMFDKLDHVMGENWDIHFEFSGKFEFYDSTPEGLEMTYHKHFKGGITLHYPKLKITNSKNMMHEINDMYIRLLLSWEWTANGQSEKDITVDSFGGYRHSATKRELMSTYTHSHISGGECYTQSYIKFNNFCQGTGEIRQVLQRLKSEFSIGQFELLLFQLPMFLSWESLEGRPYNYMERIIGKADLTGVRLSTMTNFYDNLMEKSEEASLSYSINKGNIVIKDDQNFEQFLKYKGDDLDSYSLHEVVSKSTNGDYYTIVNEPDEMPTQYLENQESRILWFRGERREFKIVEPSPENKGGKEFYVHPKIKNYVKQRIEDSIQKERVTSSISRQLNTSIDASGGTQ